MAPDIILHFVDSSVHSAAAVEFIAALPLPAGSDVILLAANPPVLQLGRALSLAAPGRAQHELERRGLRVIREFLPDDAARRWRSVTEARRPDLVVIGANSLRPKAGGPWCGIGRQLLEQSRWPLLIARAPFRGLRRVLLAVDGSPGSQAAVEFLSGFSLPADVELRVLHVASPEPISALTPPGWSAATPISASGRSLGRIAERDRPQEAIRAEQAESIVSEAVAALQSAGLRAHGRVAHGDAVEGILRDVRTRKTDLTVVGARGLGAMRAGLLGSVSSCLVQQARGPVLVVR